jgi:hypothetical protein
MVLGAHYQQFLCLSLEEILMIAMKILFEQLLKIKIEEPVGMFLGPSLKGQVACARNIFSEQVTCRSQDSIP